MPDTIFKEKIAKLLSKCNRCGFCQDVCPTYTHSKNEIQVARGRLRMIKLITEGHYDWTTDQEICEQIDSCLQCRSCVVSCPASVQTDEIMRYAKKELLGAKGFGLFHRLLYRGVLTRQQRLEIIGRLMRIYEKSGARNIVATSALQKTSDRLQYLDALFPDRLGTPARKQIGGHHPGAGKPIYRIAYFVGCATNVFLPDVAQATVNYLVSRGCTVDVPEIVCCGGPHRSAGDMEKARELARENFSRLSENKYDYILSDCSTCIYTLHTYDTDSFFLQADPVRKFIQTYRHRITDLSTFIGTVLVPDPMLSPIQAKVTYHDPCHAVRGLEITSAPRLLLSTIPKLEFIEMEGADTCCGGAGSYCFTHPDMSARILKTKISNVIASGVDILTTSCPSCMMQLTAGLRRHKANLPVRHPIELLAKSAQVIS